MVRTLDTWECTVEEIIVARSSDLRCYDNRWAIWALSFRNVASSDELLTYYVCGEVANSALPNAWVEAGTISSTMIVPDERGMIEAALVQMCANSDVIITTGGTGFGKRDVTPEECWEVVEPILHHAIDLLRDRDDGTLHAAMAK
ncbi:molybdopterin binding domain protein [Teladorsagia circumcincta]|uniref:molybdopterin molybdotransferase n=1 Tax=Teladorsagia circumcincta TaxID=45464 RepID=A0A2G9V5V7_TELCI|nr:molybdopterin binding domain protein [Teladorsagia circumcincta]